MYMIYTFTNLLRYVTHNNCYVHAPTKLLRLLPPTFHRLLSLKNTQNIASYIPQTVVS